MTIESTLAGEGVKARWKPVMVGGAGKSAVLNRPAPANMESAADRNSVGHRQDLREMKVISCVVEEEVMYTVRCQQISTLTMPKGVVAEQ